MSRHISRLNLPVALGLLAAAAACDGSDPAAPEIAEGPDTPTLPAEVSAFISGMNAHRVSVGCGELSWNGEVAQVAQAHSQDMVERDYFAHTSPDGDSPFDRLNEAGVSWSSAAENIAYGFTTGESVLNAWLNSSGHRANIENCNLTEHGVGLEGTHWTHLFIRP
jgi:uncharacterized protein YkwD